MKRQPIFVLLLFLFCINVYSLTLNPQTASVLDWVNLSKNGSSTPPEIYNRIFPYYAEICTVTQYKKIELQKEGCDFAGSPFDLYKEPEKIQEKCIVKGGFGGHATIFLNGACLDEKFNYPRLKMCDNISSLYNGDSGIGISANGSYKNVNWLAIPGRNLFFHGKLKDSEPLDQKYFDNFNKEMAESKYFDNIELSERGLNSKPGDRSYKVHRVVESLGTDFALTLGRTVFCTRLPVNPPIMSKIVEYLNGRNDYYQTSGKEYKWNILYNNCSHLAYNTLAHSGIIKEKLVDPTGIFSKLNIHNLSLPANVMINIAEMGNLRDLFTPQELLGLTDLNNSREEILNYFKHNLFNYNRIYPQPGVLNQVYKIHPAEKNGLFLQGRDPMLLALWPLTNNRKVRDALYLEPKYSNLAENFNHFSLLYDERLAQIEELEGIRNLDTMQTLLLGRYKEYLLSEIKLLTENQKLLKKLN